MSYSEPTLSQLAALLRSWSQGDSAGSSPAVLSATGGAADMAVAGERDELRRWLNTWGCRLRYPQPGEPDVFSDSLARWWASSGSGLPDVPVAELSDAGVGTLADSYADLAARPAALLTRAGAPAGHRAIAPTAASKIMFALRPETVPPWDAAIARATAGGTSRDHFASHLEAARAWAGSVQDEARRHGIADVPAYVGQPGSSLARVWDEWLYLTITRGCHVPD
jgi:hypothetical protein